MCINYCRRCLIFVNVSNRRIAAFYCSHDLNSFSENSCKNQKAPREMSKINFTDPQRTIKSLILFFRNAANFQVKDNQHGNG